MKGFCSQQQALVSVTSHCGLRWLNPPSFQLICKSLAQHTHPFQQFVLQERLDHIVGCGEVPRLMNEVDSFESSWERILGISNTQNVTEIKRDWLAIQPILCLKPKLGF